MISPLFTSLDRVRSAANLTVNSYDGELLSCLLAASAMMQGYMSRGIRIESRTESKWATPSGIAFLKAFPVSSVASVQVANGAGGWRTLSASEYWLADDNELHIVPALKPRTPISIVYTGGLAAPTLRFTVIATSVTGTPEPGAVAADGGIVGTLISWSSAGVAVISTTAGNISAGMTITGADFSFVVAESAQEVDLSGARDLQKACEQQAVYMHQRRNSLGRQATTTGGTTTFTGDYDLLPGVKRVCDLYDPQLVV